MSDVILFVGMNPTAMDEVSVLRKLGNQVIFIKSYAEPEPFELEGNKYDFNLETDRRRFSQALGLPEPQRRAAEGVLAAAHSKARDELAGWIAVWARVELGGSAPHRLIISGHHAGFNTFWGDQNGLITAAVLKMLGEAFPKGAKAIEDLHLSACYTATYVSDWLKIFPNVKTIWAYQGSAPGAHSGSGAHLRRWDQATRGSQHSIDRAVARGTRKGEEVAVWSHIYGYQGPTTESAGELRASVASREPIFQDFFRGERTVSSTQSGPLRDYYNALQTLIGHAEITGTERTRLEKRRDVTIRLIYYDKSIKGHFDQKNAALITSGFGSVGMAPPSFGTIDRKSALDQIVAFETRARRVPDASVLRLLPHLTLGLRDLSREYIPDNWI